MNKHYESTVWALAVAAVLSALSACSKNTTTSSAGGGSSSQSLLTIRGAAR